MRAPAGYYGPRIAVGAAATVGSFALFEVISGALSYWSQPVNSSTIWREDWDDGVEDVAAPSGDEVAPEAAAMAAASQLRRAGDRRVGHRILVFVRHAQPEGVVAAEGANQAALSKKGQRQAELTGQRLQALFGDDVRLVHTSGAPEAKATAEAIRGCLGKHCSVKESALLAEGMPAMPSPVPAALGEVSAEELRYDSARAEGAFRAHFWRPTGEEPDKVGIEVIVSHGNILRYLVCRALQLPETAWSRLAAHHCAVTWLEVDPAGGVTLREFGGAGHLSPELITYR